MSTLPFNNPFDKSAATPASTTPSGTDKDSVEDLLNSDGDGEEEAPEPKAREAKDDSDDKPIEDDDKDEEQPEDDDSDDEDTEETEEDADDEELDFASEVPPAKKAILKEYPDFFKKFPSIEKVLFRDKEINELFGSFDNAREAANKIQQVDAFEAQLLKGDTTNLLSSIKNADTKAFDRIVDDYLPMLQKVDNEAYLEVCGNLGKQIIMGMVKQGRNAKNVKLIEAAEMLNQYLFMSSEFEEPTRRTKESDKDEDTELKNERQQFQQERFETAKNDISTRIDNALSSTISKFIDPRGNLSEYEKNKAVEDTLSRLHNRVGRDSGFRNTLNNLWRTAFKNKYSPDSMNAIRKAYLGKSKVVLQAVIKEVRSEVLRGRNVRGKSDNEDTPTTKSETKPKQNAGRPSQQRSKANERKPGQSIQDYFMQD